MLLADKGKVNTPGPGTVDLLNAGWVVTQLRPMGPQTLTPPHSVAVFFEVDLAKCNRPLELVFELVDDDGHTVELPGPAGPQPMKITQQVTVRPPPAPTGTPGAGNSLIEVQPGLPLNPGFYQWKVTLDGEHKEDWGARFYVSEPPAQAPQMFTFGGAPPKA